MDRQRGKGNMAAALRALSSEADTRSREETAIKQRVRAAQRFRETMNALAAPGANGWLAGSAGFRLY
ncbi:MAG: hypothetical protein P0Y66_04420 [Candidatus Kaistia colombiensis]|nr:MAG: hypothetical protein P0Y66_04420 [Kaistia sp.]